MLTICSHITNPDLWFSPRFLGFHCTSFFKLKLIEIILLNKKAIKKFVGRKFGSLTFAKRWLVCRAKGNVPNVGWLSAFLSCGSAKKLNLFSFTVISFFILKPFSLSFSLSLSFLRLVGNGMRLNLVRVCVRFNCRCAGKSNAAQKCSNSTEPRNIFSLC
jgi:hypothetical protein